MDNISVFELKELLDKKTDFQFLDIRESHMYEHSHIPGAQSHPRFLIRRGNFGELDKEKQTVIYCLSNINCPEIRDLMRENGFKNIRCLDKGIAGWVDEIDPDMDLYL
ncbi:MAG: hypothetical protein JXR53_03010 [Bacteroidales bacterium]|nr:hypothetical protein [Bacteroidales bacterium]